MVRYESKHGITRAWVPVFTGEFLQHRNVWRNCCTPRVSWLHDCVRLVNFCAQHTHSCVVVLCNLSKRDVTSIRALIVSFLLQRRDERLRHVRPYRHIVARCH